MIRKSKIALFGAVLGATAVLAAPAQAQDFDFKGKQIKLTIGFGFGGTYGQYSRLFAEHLKKHIPGNPNIIVNSRPGAGGLLATNYAAKAMPADGLNYLVPPDSAVVVQLMRPKKAKFDMSKFTWIGSANQTNVILVVRSDTGVRPAQHFGPHGFHRPRLHVLDHAGTCEQHARHQDEDRDRL